MSDPRRDPEVLAFLRWLNAQGGWADADDEALERWSGDRWPTDTVNFAFGAKLAAQRGGEDDFTIHLLPAGVEALGQSAASGGEDLTTGDASS